MDIGRALATAKRLIEANGQAVVWRRPFRAAPVGQPWRDVDMGVPVDTPITVLWLKPKLRSLAFMAMLTGTEIPAGIEEALMPAYDFEPELSDFLVDGGVERTIDRVDIIKPNGTPILYYLRVAR